MNCIKCTPTFFRSSAVEMTRRGLSQKLASSMWAGLLHRLDSFVFKYHFLARFTQLKSPDVYCSDLLIFSFICMNWIYFQRFTTSHEAFTFHMRVAQRASLFPALSTTCSHELSSETIFLGSDKSNYSVGWGFCSEIQIMSLRGTCVRHWWHKIQV